MSALIIGCISFNLCSLYPNKYSFCNLQWKISRNEELFYDTFFPPFFLVINVCKICSCILPLITLITLLETRVSLEWKPQNWLTGGLRRLIRLFYLRVKNLRLFWPEADLRSPTFMLSYGQSAIWSENLSLVHWPSPEIKITEKERTPLVRLFIWTEPQVNLRPSWAFYAVFSLKTWAPGFTRRRFGLENWRKSGQVTHDDIFIPFYLLYLLYGAQAWNK